MKREQEPMSNFDRTRAGSTVPVYPPPLRVRFARWHARRQRRAYALRGAVRGRHG